jgi:hypothetical protein
LSKTGCKIDLYVDVSYQKLLKAHGKFLTTTRPFASFQLTPKAMWTLETRNGVQNCHKMDRQGKLAIFISLIQALRYQK